MQINSFHKTLFYFILWAQRCTELCWIPAVERCRPDTDHLNCMWVLRWWYSGLSWWKRCRLWSTRHRLHSVRPTSNRHRWRLDNRKKIILQSLLLKIFNKKVFIIKRIQLLAALLLYVMVETPVWAPAIFVLIGTIFGQLAHAEIVTWLNISFN
jgi:hypothetical protein